MNEINQIANTNLFIGDCWAASDLNKLQQFNIKHVINIGAHIKEYSDISYYHVMIQDNPNENIIKHFNYVFNIIDNNNQNILINCSAGVSRSASFVIGYLIYKGNNYNTSYNILQKCRSIINPNKGFIDQLKNYEASFIK